MGRNMYKNLLSILLMLFISAGVWAQSTVSGRVTSAEDRSALIGVSVIQKGTNSGVVSDESGNYSIQVSGPEAILIFSYVGLRNVEVTVGKQTVVNVVMESDYSTFSDVVVTASRQAVRKLETTTAVEIIGSKQLQRSKPEGILEAITSAPGVFTNTSQGRRGFVVTRGFPDGSPTGGLVYTGIMLDGIPTLGTPGKVPEAGFGFDLNVERVEVVRGSAATIFGRASAAGVVNVITRTGGEKLGGAVRLTSYNDILGTGNFNYRADFNLNGPLAKNLRFNVGGWTMQDDGFRNTGYKDEGYQVRGNIDWLIPDNRGSLRVYGMVSDFNFQNLSDVALNPNTLTLAPGWKNTDTYQSQNLTGINFTIVEGSGATRRFVLDANGRQITRNLGQAMAGGSYGRINQAGFKLDHNLGSGWSLNNHFRYQTIETGVKYGFALPSFYAPTTVLRLYLDGDAVDKDLINEFRINKRIESGNNQHLLSAGVYYSTINQKPTTYSYLYNSTTDPKNIRASGIFPAGSPAPTTGSITRRGDYDENVTAFFIGDEIKFDNRLTINIGARMDMLDLDMEETKIPYDKTLTRNESFSDWSASLGANYLLSDRSALYGNVIRAYRMPDYSAFTSLERRADGKFLRLPDGLAENEVIFNTELGVRTGFEGFGFDVALFYTNIDNRLASIFEDGLLVSKPLGQNRIQGAEASISFTGIRGLFVRSALTFQDGRFADFKIPVSKTGTNPNVNPSGNLYGNTLINEGNNNYSIDLKDKRIPGVPNLIWNFVANYEYKYFGLDFSANVNAGRYADATNIIELGTLTIINVGAYARLPIRNNQDVRLGIQARNLLNAEAIQGIAGVADNDTVLLNKQRNPTFTNLLAHGYTQLPGRVMVTLSYNF